MYIIKHHSKIILTLVISSIISASSLAASIGIANISPGPVSAGPASSGSISVGVISSYSRSPGSISSDVKNSENIINRKINTTEKPYQEYDKSTEDNIKPDEKTYAVMSNNLETLYSSSPGNSQGFLSPAGGDYAITSGEVNYKVNGVSRKIDYQINSNTAEEVAASLNTFKTRTLEKIQAEQGNSTASYGSLRSPKNWGENGTQGEIYAIERSDGRHYFEKKQDGNPSQNLWYYPEDNKDNAWWKIVHTVEYYAITSDPQYARTPQGVDQKELAKPAIYNQYKLLNSLKNTYGDAFKGTIINGDITDFGHDWQWDEMNKAMATLNHDYWYGLGNHDYENNVNDCFSNNCAVRSIRELSNSIETRKNINAVDYSVITGYKFPSLFTNYIGSFSYSFDMSGIRFIQLNNYAEYTKEFSGYSAGDARKYTVQVTPSVDWLEQQLADARKKGKAIVLLSHIQNLGTVDSHLHKMTAKNSDYDITAIFNGHTHKMSTSDYVSNSGATFTETFLLVEVNNLKKEMSIYEVSNNDLTTKKLSVTIPLKLSVVDKTIKENAFTLTLKNVGGYVGTYTIDYTREDGSKASVVHRLALGNAVNVQIPRGSKNIEARGKTGSGRIIYGVRLNDYRNTCIASWGTLPKNLHWGYCG